MEEKMMQHVSSNPHVRAKDTTSRIMLLVCIALLPACGVGIYQFGIRALLHIVITVAVCVITEYLYQYFMKKDITVKDFSAVVTGLLLAMNLPVYAPLWIGAVGGVFAILVVKQLFGGLGQNFMNPALAARCFLLISFSRHMTNFFDGQSGATPLAALKNGESVNTWKMVIGTCEGVIGETSAIAILIGAVILLMAGVISIRIPACYLGSFVVFLLLFGGKGFDMSFITAHLAGGGLMLGAWFMATDYVTSPITTKGQILYGVILGVLTGIFRIFGNSAEGVSYAIIFGNLLVPLIEKITIPTAFGKGKFNYVTAKSAGGEKHE